MLEQAPATLYKRDFNLWVGTQVEALRARRFEDLDLPNVIEELEDLANRHRDAVESQLARLFLHLLKACYQPEKRTPSWDKSINGAVTAIFKQLRKISSLRREVAALAIDAYADARRSAAKETRLARSKFPSDLPPVFLSIAEAIAKATTDDDLDAVDALIAKITGPFDV